MLAVKGRSPKALARYGHAPPKRGGLYRPRLSCACTKRPRGRRLAHKKDASGGGRAKAAPSVRSDSSAASDKAGTLKPRSDKRRAMVRIEHSLLDRGRSSTPSDLRPSPAPPPYHTKVTDVSIYRQRAGTPD